MTLTYILNGLELHDPDAGFKLLSATQWAGGLTIRNAFLTVPTHHGSIPVWNVPVEPGGIQMRVRITGDDAADLNDKWNELVRHLGVGINQPVTIERIRNTPDGGDGQQVTAAAQLASVEPPDFSCAATFVDTTLAFAIPEGRWFGDHTTEILDIPGSNQIVNLAADSTMPITDAMFLAKGPLSSLSVDDNVSQTGFIWSGANVLSDEWLLVDLQTYTAWIKETEDYELDGTQVSSALRSRLLGWLSLVPGIAPGVAASSVTVGASGTTVDTVCTLRARPAYH